MFEFILVCFVVMHIPAMVLATFEAELPRWARRAALIALAPVVGFALMHLGLIGGLAGRGAADAAGAWWAVRDSWTRPSRCG